VVDGSGTATGEPRYLAYAGTRAISGTVPAGYELLEVQRQLGLSQVPLAGAGADVLSLMMNLAQGVTWAR
jgi:hypothetical protein